MTGSPQRNLERLDAALLGLRRLISAPAARPALDHQGGRIEVSTMLVVDAVARTSAGAGCSVSDVAEALTVAHSTASRLVERAVSAGVLTRTRDPDRGRRAVLLLTDSGRRLQQQASRFRTARLAEVTGAWTAEDVAALTALLERFAADALPHLSVPARRTLQPNERNTR